MPGGAGIRLHPGLREATFVARLNRFAALVECEGEETVVHVANSGRLAELLHPDNVMLLSPARPGSRRKTAFDLALVKVGEVLVSADAILPNALLREAIEGGSLPEFSGYERLAAEVVFGDSRLDIALSGPGGTCYVEVKSVTLVEDGIGLFPDAPTERGRKHLASLVSARQLGHRAAVAFVVQRGDARSFSPNQDADPEFCRMLREAVELGVEAYAYRCSVSRQAVEIADALPVVLR